MEGLTVLFIIVGALVILSALALRYGVDSRPSYLDD
jgi:hypothetical protein